MMRQLKLNIKITRSERKYITYLYETKAFNGKKIGTTQIARALNISPPTAVEAMEKLASKGLIKFVKRKGVELTNEGINTAKRILRKHRILEILFYTTTRLPIEEICEKLKKVDVEFDDALIEEIYKNLGQPKCCPHGKDIP